MDIKGVPGKVLERNNKHVIKLQRKDNFCYNIAENLAELCSTVGQKKGQTVVGWTVYMKKIC